jgi:excisionase family DNA binding protein
MAEYIDAIHLATMFSGEGIDLSYNDIVDMINMGDLKGRPSPTTFEMQADVQSASALISKISMISAGSFTSKRYTFEDVAKKTGFSKRVVSKLFAAGEIPTQMDRDTGEQYASGIAIKKWFNTIRTQFRTLTPEVQAEFFRTHQPEPAIPTPALPWEPVVTETPTPAQSSTPTTAPSAFPQAPSSTPMAPPAAGTIAEQQAMSTPGMHTIHQVAERYQTTVAEVQSWVKQGILQGTTYTKQYGQKGDWQWEEERTYFTDQELKDLEAVKLAQYGFENLSPEMMGEGWNLDETDAAEAIGVDKSEIPNLILTGRLVGKKIGTKWEISSKSVAQYMQNMVLRMVFADFSPEQEEVTAENAFLFSSTERTYYTPEELSKITGKSMSELYRYATETMNPYQKSPALKFSDVQVGDYARTSYTYTAESARHIFGTTSFPQLSDAKKTHLSESDVAQRLRVSERQVEGWIKSGQLEAEKVGTRYRISPDAAERFRRDMMGYYTVPEIQEKWTEERDTITYGEFEDIFGQDPTRLVAEGTLLTERVGGKREITIASVNQFKNEQAAIFNQSADNWMSRNQLGYNVLNLQKIQRRF